ncbi:MAG: hypothetical protein IKP22_05270 [Clostridia bacterium]|nr:hypothetical protein [Clostridia bacterium]
MKAEEEETGIGFYCWCTTVTPNRNLQIKGIRIVYDVPSKVSGTVRSLDGTAEKEGPTRTERPVRGLLF